MCYMNGNTNVFLLLKKFGDHLLPYLNHLNQYRERNKKKKKKK